MDQSPEDSVDKEKQIVSSQQERRLRLRREDEDRHQQRQQQKDETASLGFRDNDDPLTFEAEEKVRR